jgi:hypothetical protein
MVSLILPCGFCCNEIADRYEQIGRAAAEHGPITKLGRQRKRA